VGSDELLRTHEIDPDALRAADFDSLFLARRAGLLRLVEGAMSKTAQRDIDESELVGVAEAPSKFDATDQVDDLGDIIADDTRVA
jgi:hypothetical protein